MIRAFVAISLPANVLKELELLRDRLKQLNLDARLVKTGGIHLTLKFLGYIEPSQVDPIGERLEQKAESFSIFTLELGHLGVFPNLRSPRVVWLGTNSHSSLLKLQSAVESSLIPFGFEPEKRAFKPHLTLARLKSRKNLSGLRSLVEEDQQGNRNLQFKVDAIHLYQSVLKPTGAVYSKLKTARLREET